MQTLSNDRLRSEWAASQLLAKALCQYYGQALINTATRFATSLSESQYRKNLGSCGPDIDAIQSSCAASCPDFGLTAADFRAAIGAAADKYLIGFAPREEAPSVDEIREFVGELQHSDLYLALACERGNDHAWQQFDRDYRPFIERLARHLARTGSDADEVIDSVYAELFGTKIVDGARQSKFKSYTGRGTLRGWLRAVVTNAVVDLYRGRQSEISLDNWSESGGDRYGLLNSILTKLQREGWQHKTDTGWSAFDVEIFGSRWSRLRLTTATEELAQGHKVFRCQLSATWSLTARIAFWSTAGVELAIIGLVAPSHPWIWMLLLSLPALGWWLEQERHRLLLWIAALLDEIATEQKLVKVRQSPPGEVRT